MNTAMTQTISTLIEDYSNSTLPQNEIIENIGITLDAIDKFVNFELITCDDLIRYIEGQREMCGRPLSNNEKWMLISASEQTDTYIKEPEYTLVPEQVL